MRKRSFTLLELLLVVAVIAILASMLLPALGKAKAMGRKSQCANNLKQIGVAFIMYTEDSAGWLPVGTGAPSPAGSWCYQLASYLKIDWLAGSYWPRSGSPVFYCPAALICTTNSTVQQKLLYNLSYGYNRFFYDTAQGKCRKLASVSRPSSCLLAADFEYIDVDPYVDGANYSGYVCAVVGNPNSLSDWKPQFFAYRHLKKANILFVDGHISSSGMGVGGFPEGFYFYEGGASY